jgi:hypothetical protein
MRDLSEECEKMVDAIESAGRYRCACEDDHDLR